MISRAVSSACVLVLAFGLSGCSGSDDTSDPEGSNPNDDGSGGEGAGGGGSATGDDFTPGDPITAADDEWTWVPVAGSRCMTNAETGFGVKLNPASDKVLLILAGGNACFSTITCMMTANQASGYGENQFNGEKSGLSNIGAFNRNDATNPFKDWNHVYVPYCSGDVFSGDSVGTFGNVERQFRGYVNMGLFLERIVPTFPDATQVVLAGMSAGGFGAAYNLARTQDAFGDIPVLALDDSGPPMSNDYLHPCIQNHFRVTWGLDETLPKDCADCSSAEDGSFMEAYMNYIGTKYPNHPFGLISSDEDTTIKQFWGYGENECASILGMPPGYPTGKFGDGLEDMRDMISPYPNMKVFELEGTGHVWIDKSPSKVTSGGVSLQTWIEQMLSGDAAWDHVTP